MFVFFHEEFCIGLRGDPLCEGSDHFGNMCHVEWLILPVKVSRDEGVESANGFADLGVKMVLSGVVVPE